MYDISAGEFNIYIREVYAKLQRLNVIFYQLDQNVYYTM